MTVNYSTRNGRLAAVLLCPTIVANDHLVYFDYDTKSLHWVIRDFITGQRLDNFNNDSRLTVRQIEEDATYAESPAWLAVLGNIAEWRNYLMLRTTAVLDSHRSLGATNPPNPASGTWQPLRQ